MYCSRPRDAQSSAPIALVLLLLLFGSACSEGGTKALPWRIRFACDADRSASDHVRLRIRAGGCEGDIVYEALSSRSEPPATGDDVGPGRYGFEAAAFEADRVLAQVCEDAEVPRTEALELVLATERCAEAGDDAGAQRGPTRDAAADGQTARPQTADAAAEDAGRHDAYMAIDPGAARDAQTQDADAANPGPGAQPLDAGPQGGPTQHADAGPPGDADAGLGACRDCDASSCAACDAAAGCAQGAACDGGTEPSSCVALSNDGHRYLLCSDPRTWNAARDHCRSWGGGLAIIESAAENAFLTANLAGTDRWIGANDRGQERTFACWGGSQQTWYWASTNTDSERDLPLCAAWSNGAGCVAIGGAYQNWRSGQPDDWQCACSFNGCSGGEDCATILAEDGRWNDSRCDLERGYICESP